jgi:uncharacterized protein
VIQIIVAHATPQRQLEISLSVEENCTVALAIQRSGLLQQFPGITLGRSAVGIYGQRVALDDLVHDGDRIEIYRPLPRDPKQIRLARAKKILSEH